MCPLKSWGPVIAPGTENVPAHLTKSAAGIFLVGLFASVLSLFLAWLTPTGWESQEHSFAMGATGYSSWLHGTLWLCLACTEAWRVPFLLACLIPLFKWPSRRWAGLMDHLSMASVWETQDAQLCPLLYPPMPGSGWTACLIEVFPDCACLWLGAASQNVCCYCSVTQSCLTLWDPMDCSTPGFPVLHSLSLRVCSDSCPLSWWCHPTIPSSVTPFFSCPQSFPASGSFPTWVIFNTALLSSGAPWSPLPVAEPGKQLRVLAWNRWYLRGGGDGREFNKGTVHKCRHVWGSHSRMGNTSGLVTARNLPHSPPTKTQSTYTLQEDWRRGTQQSSGFSAEEHSYHQPWAGLWGSWRNEEPDPSLLPPSGDLILLLAEPN